MRDKAKTRKAMFCGNEIRSEVRLTDTFLYFANLYLISIYNSNRCGNIPADRSSLQLDAYILVLLCRHKIKYFRQAFISSGVDREITDNACLKSPANNIYTFPNGRLFPCKSCFG